MTKQPTLKNIRVIENYRFGNETPHMYTFLIEIDGVDYKHTLTKFPMGWFFTNTDTFQKVGGVRGSYFSEEKTNYILNYVRENLPFEGDIELITEVEEVEEVEEQLQENFNFLYQLPFFYNNAQVGNHFNMKIRDVKGAFTSDKLNYMTLQLKSYYELHNNLTHIETASYRKDTKMSILLNHLRYQNPDFLKQVENMIQVYQSPYDIITELTQLVKDDIIKIESTIIEYVRLKGGEI